MAENNIEKRVSDLETRQTVQDERFNTFIQSMDDFKQEIREFKIEMRNNMQDFKIEMRNNMQDFKNEMRQQNEMRAAELLALRQKQDADAEALRQAQAAQQARHDQTMEEIRKENRNLLTAFVGVAVAILIGIFWK